MDTPIGTIFHDAPRVQGESRVTWYDENTATMSMPDETTSDEVTPDETISLRDNRRTIDAVSFIVRLS